MNQWPIEPATVALGEWGEIDAAEVERLMADPAFAAEVAAFAEVASRLASLGEDAWRTDGPPALDPAMFATAPSRSDQRREPIARRRRWWPALVGSAVAAVLVVVAFATRPGGDSVRTVALAPVDGTPGSATIELGAHEMHLVGTGLPSSAPGTHYEAWLGRADGSMVSVGTFTVGPSRDIDGRMRLEVDPADFTDIDVSLEPDDGDPAHSQVSVFHARI